MKLPYPQGAWGRGGGAVWGRAVGGTGGGSRQNFFKSNLHNFTSNTKLANLLPRDNKCGPEFGSVPLSLPHLNSE